MDNPSVPDVGVPEGKKRRAAPSSRSRKSTFSKKAKAIVVPGTGTGDGGRLKPADHAYLLLAVRKYVEKCLKERGGNLVPSITDLREILQRKDTTKHHAIPEPNPMDRLDPAYEAFPGGDVGAGSNAACCAGLSPISVFRPDPLQLGTRMWKHHTLKPFLDALEDLLEAWDDPEITDGSETFSATDKVEDLRRDRSLIVPDPGRPMYG